MAFIRSFDQSLSPRLATFWSLGAATFAAILVFIAEFLWRPALVLGDYAWALHVIAVAAAMTFMAERTAKWAPDANRELRVALFGAAALSLISLSLFILLTKTALTLGLGVMILSSVWIDRKYGLKQLSAMTQIGIVIVGYRLIVDPGFVWAVERASLVEASLAYLGTIMLFAAAWYICPRRDGNAKIMLESAIWTFAAVYLTVLLSHLLDNDLWTHYGLGLLATVWLATAMNQIYRTRTGSRFRKVLRIILASVFMFVALLAMTIQATFLSPLATDYARGPLVFDSFAVAYLPIAAVFGVSAWKLVSRWRWVRPLLVSLSGLYVATYVILEIRRFWRGPNVQFTGMSDGELYTYTLALLATSVALLFFAFGRRSVLLRRVAMAGVLATIAKVFLIDMSGLTGLIRVASFIGLGLSLAGFAWLNRKMSAQWDRKEPSKPEM